MADEGEGADSVLARIQGQSDVFEAGVDRTDAKVNDGNSKTFGKSKKNKKNPWFSAKAPSVPRALSPSLALQLAPPATR